MVTPNGKRTLEILSLSTIHDEIGGEPERGAGLSYGDKSAKFMNRKGHPISRSMGSSNFPSCAFVLFLVTLGLAL